LVLLPFSLDVNGETIQLIDESVEIKSDSLPNYTSKQLKEIQDVKILLIQFIKSPPEVQVKSLSPKYKRVFQDTEKELTRAFGKETYSKISFKRIEFFSENNMTIKTNVYWQDEGYDGLQTYYFKFIKINNSWLVEWILY